MLSFQRKSLSFENALSYLKAFTKTHICFLKEKQSVPTLQFTVRSEWRVASLSKCCPFRRKSLSFESALSYLHTFTGNSNAFLWKRSTLFQHFNSLHEGNGVLLHFLNAVLSEKITFLWKCLKLLTAFNRNSHAFHWKRSSLFQHFNSLCEVNGVLLYFLNAVL